MKNLTREKNVRKGVMQVGAHLRGGGQAARPISSGPLHPLRGVHVRPINLVVYQGPLET